MAVMGLPQRQPYPWLLFLLMALIWPQPCRSLGEWGSGDWMHLARPKGLGHLLE